METPEQPLAVYRYSRFLRTSLCLLCLFPSLLFLAIAFELTGEMKSRSAFEMVMLIIVPVLVGFLVLLYGFFSDPKILIYSDRICFQRLFARDIVIAFTDIRGFHWNHGGEYPTIEYFQTNKAKRLSFTVSFGAEDNEQFLSWLRAHFVDLGKSAAL